MSHFTIGAKPGVLEALTRNSTQWVAVRAECDGITYSNAGLRLKGSLTKQDFTGKPSFTLKLNWREKGQAFHGNGKWHLHNASYNPSYLNE